MLTGFYAYEITVGSSVPHRLCAMGAASSTTSLSIVNSSIINAVIDQAQECNSAVASNQVINISGKVIGSTISADASVSLSCIQQVTINDSIIATMANNIQQQAAANNISLLPGFSNASDNTSLKNYLTANVTNDTIQKACAQASANQLLNVASTGVVVDSTISTTASNFTTSMQTVLNSTNVAQGIVDTGGQGAASTNNTSPISQLGGLISGILDSVWTWIAVVILIVIGLIVGGMWLFGGKGGPAEEEQGPEPVYGPEPMYGPDMGAPASVPYNPSDQAGQAAPSPNPFDQMRQAAPNPFDQAPNPFAYDARSYLPAVGE
jgi:hypothetical protein